MEQPHEVVVRLADVHDASGIAEVHVRSWQEAYAGIVPDSYLADLDPHERTPVWADLLSRGPADEVRTWVAVVGDRIVGFASLGPGRDEDSLRADREIYSMYLSPEQWGRGVARELMRTVIAEAGAGRRLVLWVMADNQRAQHFWRRHGFQPDGIERYEDVGGAELLEVRYRRG